MKDRKCTITISNCPKEAWKSATPYKVGGRKVKKKTVAATRFPVKKARILSLLQNNTNVFKYFFTAHLWVSELGTGHTPCFIFIGSNKCSYNTANSKYFTGLTQLHGVKFTLQTAQKKKYRKNKHENYFACFRRTPAKVQQFCCWWPPNNTRKATQKMQHTVCFWQPCSEAFRGNYKKHTLAQYQIYAMLHFLAMALHYFCRTSITFSNAL